MMRLTLGVSLLVLAGCPAAEEAPAPVPAPAPAPAPAPTPPPAPAAPAAMDVTALNAAREANVGKSVTVKGVVGTVKKGASNVDITVKASDAADADSIVCTTTDLSMEADLSTLAENTPVTVAGVVDAAAVDGKTHLTSCMPVEGGVGRGKAKAGDGEGGAKAGKGDKAGKQKAH